MSILDLRITISRRLLVWSGLSMLAGVVLIQSNSLFWRGFGIQAIAWGIVDAVIALAGYYHAQRRPSQPPNTREARKLRRILWVNTGLDVLYVVGGVVLFSVVRSIFWQGHGWGIVLQGGFLFFFDLIHAQAVPPSVIPKPLRAFQDPEHLPFLWRGGRPAALLVHGFPGTPAEMRPLGESLHRVGWTVEAILLPGFGHQIATLEQRRHEEWLAAVAEALAELKHQHSPVLLVGYSMGGALATITASSQPPDGLVLLAPFWRIGSPLKVLVGLLLRPFLPRYFRPFKQMDFSDPEVQNALRNFLPNVDLDDPEVQNDVRLTVVPISIFDELRRLGKHAYRQARSVDVPLLIIQGQRDELVKPEYTKRLPVQDAARYLEIDAGHDLMNTGNPDWPILEKTVLDFADSLSPSIKRERDATEIALAENSSGEPGD